jgi:hypothetical protein
MSTAAQPIDGEAQDRESTPPIPEPYNLATNRVQSLFRRIYRCCKRWPWDLGSEIEPDKWAQSMLEKLASVVEQVSIDDSQVTLSELVAWLKDEAQNEKDELVDLGTAPAA